MLSILDAIIEKTAYIYRKAQERRVVRGRTTSAILAASIYIAYREIGMPRTLKDISAISNIKRKDLARVLVGYGSQWGYTTPAWKLPDGHMFRGGMAATNGRVGGCEVLIEHLKYEFVSL